MGMFDGSGRLGRLNYFAIWLGLTLLNFLAIVTLVTVDEVTGEPSVSPWILPLMVVSTWVSWTSLICRLHDLGRSGWTVLLFLVPFVNIGMWFYVLFAPGDPVPNRYGRPPGGTPQISPEVHKARMELLTNAAGQAYRARAGAAGAYLKEDGSFNVDGLAMSGAGEQPAQPSDEQAPPNAGGHDANLS